MTSQHKPDRVVHPFSPSKGEAEASGSVEFEDNLIYRVSSRLARATYTVSKKATHSSPSKALIVK